MIVTRRSAMKLWTSTAAASLFGPAVARAFGRIRQTTPGPIRMKLEDFVTHQDLMEALKRGVRTMKARKPSDPRSWFFQAAVHGVSDAAVEEAKASDPDVANVDRDRFWNQCPHFERLQAPSADFLIWHRAYVYHFERILRAAAGDDRLALPYWNYLVEGQGVFPAAYADPDPVPDGQPDAGRPRNPLYDARRENAFTLGLLELNPLAINTTRAFAQKQFFGAVSSQGFAGSVTELGPSSQGLIERNPHNPVHFAIGGFIGTNPDGTEGTAGLMSEVVTAAFDPIFWAHHCNIDRIWSVWECLPDRQWGNAPPRSWFEERRWWFHDAQGDAVNQTRAFYLQQKSLGITFDTDVPDAKRLTDQLPAEPGPINFSLRDLSKRAERSPEDRARTIIIGTTDAPIAVTAKAAVHARLNIKAERPFGAESLKRAIADDPGKPARRAFLVMQGVRYTGVPTASYEVYVNLPDSDKPTPGSQHFVGVLALFGTRHGGQEQSHGHAQPGGHAQAGGHGEIFDVSQFLSDSATGELRVSFVPVPLLRQVKPDAIVRPTKQPKRPEETVTIDEANVVLAESRSAGR
jgi:hypothetical protein